MKYGLSPSPGSRKLPFSVEEAKLHSRETDEANSLEISAMIKAATLAVEQRLELALIEQEYEMVLESFPSSTDPYPIPDYDASFPARFGNTSQSRRFPLRIDLPIGNVTEIVSIEYVDVNDDLVELDPDEYRLATGIKPPYVFPKTVWPEFSRTEPNPVRIKFKAGFGTEPGDIPEDIVHAVKMVFGHFWENREDVTPGVGAPNPAILPRNSDWLLSLHRWR